MSEKNTPETQTEQELVALAFNHVALDPQCEIFIQYLEAEKRALLNLLGDARIRREATLTQSYVGELKAYDDLLMNIYDKMSPDKKEAREKRTMISGFKRFFNVLLTKRLKGINTPNS